jgi:predicted ABC-type ATPase
VNADLIAAGLSPFAPEEVAFRAGRLMLEEIKRLEAEHVSFAFETTLPGKSYLPLIRRLRGKGYSVHLMFVWPQAMELTLHRIRERVRLGGHHIPDEDVQRRFLRTVRNLFQYYQAAVNSWVVYDNSGEDFVMIAQRAGGRLDVRNPEAFEALRMLGESRE